MEFLHETADRFVEGIPQALQILVAASIFAGTVIVVTILFTLGQWLIRSCCQPPKYKRDFISKEPNRHMLRNVLYILLLIICFLMLVYGIYYASFAAGINMLGLVFSGGFLLVFVQYTFNVSLSQIGAYLSILSSGKIQEGYQIILPDKSIGTVIAVHMTFTLIRVQTKDGYLLDHHMANTMIVGGNIIVKSVKKFRNLEV